MRPRVVLLICVLLISVLIGGTIWRVYYDHPGSVTVVAHKFLAFQTGFQNDSLSLPAAPTGGLTYLGSQISILTPPAGQPSAGGLSVNVSRGPSLWHWSGDFGLQSRFVEGATIEADNGTQSASLQLPPANVTSALVHLASVGPDFSGNYSISLALGSGTIFSQSGSSLFTPFEQLPWTAETSPVVQVAGQVSGNGTQILAEGTEIGNLTIYQVNPGLAGVPIDSRTLVAGFPITSILVAPLFANGAICVVAASAGFLFVISPPSASGQKWTETAIRVPPLPSGSDSTISGLAVSSPVGGQSQILAIDSEGTVYSSAWYPGGPSAGWSSPMGAILHAPQGSVHSMAEGYRNSSSPLLGIGGLGQVQLYTMNQSTPSLMTNLSLPASTAAVALRFNSTATGLLVAGSDGILYAFHEPWTGPPSTVTLPGGAPLGLDYDEVGGMDMAVVSQANQGVAAILSPWSPQVSSIKQTGQFTQVQGVGTPVFASVLGSSEADVLIPVGESLFAARSTVFFNSTWIDLSGVLSSVLTTMPQTTDASGNPVEILPLTLTASTGMVRLSSLLVSYNYSRELNLNSMLSPYYSSSDAKSPLPALEISAESPGEASVSLSVSFLEPPPQNLLFGFPHYLSIAGVWAVGILALAGSVLVGLGLRQYNRNPHRGTGQLPANRPKGTTKAPRRVIHDA